MPTGYPKLNFPPIKLRATPRGDSFMVWNEIRKCSILLTGEEWVRRHLVGYLTGHCGVVPQRIVEEHPVKVNGLDQRADVVVVAPDGTPLLLAECKAPEVKITRDTFDQAMRYNRVLCARYVVLTNGLQHYSYELTAEGCIPLNHFPLPHCPLAL